MWDTISPRVGYNLTTGAQYNKFEDGRLIAFTDEERKEQIRTAVSFGIGYSSPGSFFMDAAVRFQYLPNEYFTPYWYYDYENGNRYVDDRFTTPEVCSQSAWRF